MLVNSIYFRMTFWYTLALSLVTGLLSVFLYINFKHIINRDFNNLLESRAEDIAQVINEESKDRAQGGILNSLKDAVEWSQDDDIFVQVFGQDQKEIIRSSNMVFSLALAGVPADSSKRASVYFNVVLPNKKVSPARTFILRVMDNRKISYFIQITGSLSPLYLKLGRIKTRLLFFIPLAVILVAGLGIFLTRTALKPVDSMTKAMHQITLKNLKQRIELPVVNDEIKRLAETFNDMLTRLDNSFSFQQQLIQDVSHELRTPLTALKGKQEVALNKRRSAAEYEAVLTVNLEEIDKMSALVENLLILAQMDKMDNVFKVQKIDLTGLIQQVLESVRPAANKKGIKLILLSSEQITIEADNNHISRMFLNILDNAVKYTPSNGQVSVRTLKKEDFAEIVINDTGIGIALDELPHIFDRFYRADKSRSSAGFGLGLSIAKAIAAAHKGRIEVESHLNRGSAFTVCLPINYQEGRPAQA